MLPTGRSKSCIVKSGICFHSLERSCSSRSLLPTSRGSSIQSWRAGITPRGVNMKLIVLRSILRRNHLWERIRPDLSMLRVGETPGKALTLPEENKLLGECLASNSRTIHLAVVLALCTGMRRDEIRLLQWKQIYLKDGYLTVRPQQNGQWYGANRPTQQPRVQDLECVGRHVSKAISGTLRLSHRKVRWLTDRKRSNDLRTRSDKAFEVVEGRLGPGTYKVRGLDPIPRSSSHSHHQNARSQSHPP